MRYQGGKGKLAKTIAPVILNFAAGRRIVEPFHGGLSMTVALQPAIASDYSLPAHTLVKSTRAGWEPPSFVDEQTYNELKRGVRDQSDPLTCFAGQCCTFGGGWFKGYARGHPSQREPIRAAAVALKRRVGATLSTTFLHQPYWELDVLPGDVVYCDPPYKDTSQDYPVEAFDHNRFWEWARQIAEDGADVFVSEFSAPDDVAVFWEKEVAKQTRSKDGSTKIERLYHIPAKKEAEEPNMPTYPVLSVEAFGRQLIETGDLDPVYIALSKVEWDEDQLKRWLVAYWLFYHPGAASYMSEAKDEYFWNRVLNAAKNVSPPPVGERWPRASERRHFRGEKCVKAVEELRARFPDGASLVDFVAAGAPDYKAVFDRACSLPQFGPWLTFKVADQLERCLGVPIEFDLASVTMFDSPRKGALRIARERMGLVETARIKDEAGTIRQVMEHLIREFSDLSAPPTHDRAIGLQEAETVTCKWLSHVNGHYPIGKDCREIREGLAEWTTVSSAAAEFLHNMPTGDTTEAALRTA